MSILYKLSHEEQVELLSTDILDTYFWENLLKSIDDVEELGDDLTEIFIEEFGETMYKKLQ